MENKFEHCYIAGILYRTTLQALRCPTALHRQLLVAQHINVVVPGAREDDSASPGHYVYNHIPCLSYASVL